MSTPKALYTPKSDLEIESYSSSNRKIITISIIVIITIIVITAIVIVVSVIVIMNSISENGFICGSDEECNNGVCGNDKKCECDVGYKGKECDVVDCGEECNEEYGECEMVDEVAECVCVNEYLGENCMECLGVGFDFEGSGCQQCKENIGPEGICNVCLDFRDNFPDCDQCAEFYHIEEGNCVEDKWEELVCSPPCINGGRCLNNSGIFECSCTGYDEGELKGCVFNLTLRDDGNYLRTFILSDPLKQDLFNQSFALPIVFFKSPYGNSRMNQIKDFILDYPVIGVFQQNRGTFDSNGEFTVFKKDGNDTDDLIQHLKKTYRWFNRKIMTIGASANAVTQYKNLGHVFGVIKGSLMEIATPKFFSHGITTGGTFNYFIPAWITLNNLDRGHPDLYSDIIAESQGETGSFWDCDTKEDDWHYCDWPSVTLGGWYDVFYQGSIDGFIGYNQKGNPGCSGNGILVMGPWVHGRRWDQDQGELTYPANAANRTLFWDNLKQDFIKAVLLEQSGLLSQYHHVYYYIIGYEGTSLYNKWATSIQWPPLEYDMVNYYLHPNQTMNLEMEDDPGYSSTYDYDPSNPVLTNGGNNLALDNGPYCQKDIEKDRDDIIKFRIHMDSDTIVCGEVIVKLFVSSNSLDTDFTAKLIDVYDDKRQMLVINSIQRMRFREGQNQTVLMTPGTIYEIDIHLGTICYAFETGHRIQLSISSSNSPRYDRNCNTGGEIVEDFTCTYQTATNTIYYSQTYPSRLILPIASSSPTYLEE